jgi:hypothetical protein
VASAFEREHACGLETEHVALRLQERIELVGQRQLFHDDPVDRKTLGGGFDRPDGRRLGVAPGRCPPQSRTRRT